MRILHLTRRQRLRFKCWNVLMCFYGITLTSALAPYVPFIQLASCVHILFRTCHRGCATLGRQCNLLLITIAVSSLLSEAYSNMITYFH